MARTLLALACASLLGACAHAPAAPPDSGPAPSWPEPPEAPRVRWLSSFPGAATREPSFWERLLEAVAGTGQGARSADPAFVRPFGLAAEGPRRILVADPDRPAVSRVHLDTGAVESLSCRDRPWGAPMAVAVGPGGEAAVADAAAAVVVTLGASGACASLGEGVLERPTGLAYAAGRLYVVDPPQHRVVAFRPDGTEALRFGGRGEGPGDFNFPTAIAAAPDGSLYVADALNFRVAVFTPEGTFLRSFGSPGEGPGQFSRPKALAVDPGGRVFVSDAEQDRVLVFLPDGSFQFSFGDGVAGPGRLSLPAGVAVGDGEVYVTSPLAGRIQIYALLGAAS